MGKLIDHTRRERSDANTQNRAWWSEKEADQYEVIPDLYKSATLDAAFATDLKVCDFGTVL